LTEEAVSVMVFTMISASPQIEHIARGIMNIPPTSHQLPNGVEKNH